MNIRSRDLSEEVAWNDIFSHGSRHFYKRNSIIYHQGSLGDGFYYIFNGIVKIVLSTSDGNERIVDLTGPGELIGEQAMDHKPYYSTAVANEDTVLYYYSFVDFKNLMHTYPTLLSLLIDSTIQKARILSDNVMLDSLRSDQKIALVLLKLIYKLQKNEICLTQQELAAFTGVTRITVYKIFKNWRNLGIICVENRRIVVKEPDELKQQTNIEFVY
ncbi:Crp/Fnr family transcriptional regulator [Salicibibacter kimchii]|uniref:Crp/Fnr family transcriptional regulator n=1 Tax=Salicibibacter kimchii TaxID=2099786 RepID=UPI00135BAB39|nr:Crp/Fnr family transcriptional regulator [Salicibibacter kimchii]